MSPLPEYYTTAEVAEAYKTSVWTIRRKVRAGKVNPLRLSDSPTAELRWTDADLKQLEKALRPEAPVVPSQRRRRRAAA